MVIGDRPHTKGTEGFTRDLEHIGFRCRALT